MWGWTLVSVSEAIHTEAQSCLQAVLFASEAGMMKFEIQTDCLLLKTALTSGDYDASTGGATLREIRFLLDTYFIDVKV